MVDKRKKAKKEKAVRESSGIYISDDELISLIEERVPRIIRDKPYLKDRFRELFSDVFVERRDIDKVLEEMRMEREASDKKFREMMEKMDKDREEANRKFEESDRKFREMMEKMDREREEDRKRWEERMERMDREREEDRKRWEERMERMDREREEDRKRWEERMEKWEKEREEDRKRWEEMREDTNKRFEEMREDTNKRFEAITLEIKQLREDTNKRFEEMREDTNRRFEEMRNDMDKRFMEMREDMDKRFAEMREDMNKRFEAVDKRFEEIRKDFQNTISAIDGRWGEDAESVFREGIKKILSEHYKGDVKKVWIDDKEGIIKGYRAQYEIDALITDSVHIIIEIKSQANDFDVLKLHRLGEIYEKEYNVKPRLLLLGIYVRESGWKEAKNWADVEIITNPRDFKP